MDTVPIQTALGVIRRQWWIILQAVVVIGGVVAYLASRADAPAFQAVAAVQVRPDSTVANPFFQNNPSSFLAAQTQVIYSTAVLKAAADQVPGVTIDALSHALHVSNDSASGTIYVRADDVDPNRAKSIATAVAVAFVQNRQVQQTSALTDSATQVKSDLDAIENEIATLTAQLSNATSTTAAVLPGTGPTKPAVSSTTTTPQIATSSVPRVDVAVSVGKLQAGLEAKQSQYKALLQRQQDLLTQASLKTQVAELLSSADRAFQPAKPSPLKRGALGAAVGLLVGLGIAVVREVLDDRVHSRPHVEKVANRPVIAELPFDPRSANNKRRRRVSLATIERPNSLFAEATRSLRTTVTFLGVDAPIRCLTITSAEPDEGKSLVAANLAVAYAQAGVKTILLSGDLRRPSLDARMLPNGAKGFSDLVVSGFHSESNADPDLPVAVAPLAVSDVTYKTTVPNLQFVPAGTLPPNPAEILASKRAAQAVSELRASCEMLVIDSPPTIVTDGVILADLADAAVIVTAMDQSHAVRVAAAVEALTSGHVRVLGIVLNKVPHHLHMYGSQYSPYPSIAAKPGRDERFMARSSGSQARKRAGDEERLLVAEAKRVKLEAKATKQKAEDAARRKVEAIRLAKRAEKRGGAPTVVASSATAVAEAPRRKGAVVTVDADKGAGQATSNGSYGRGSSGKGADRTSGRVAVDLTDRAEALADQPGEEPVPIGEPAPVEPISIGEPASIGEPEPVVELASVVDPVVEPEPVVEAAVLDTVPTEVAAQEVVAAPVFEEAAVEVVPEPIAEVFAPPVLLVPRPIRIQPPPAPDPNVIDASAVEMPVSHTTVAATPVPEPLVVDERAAAAEEKERSRRAHEREAFAAAKQAEKEAREAAKERAARQAEETKLNAAAAQENARQAQAEQKAQIEAAIAARKAADEQAKSDAKQAEEDAKRAEEQAKVEAKRAEEQAKAAAKRAQQEAKQAKVEQRSAKRAGEDAARAEAVRIREAAKQAAELAQQRSKQAAVDAKRAQVEAKRLARQTRLQGKVSAHALRDQANVQAREAKAHAAAQAKMMEAQARTAIRAARRGEVLPGAAKPASVVEEPAAEVVEPGGFPAPVGEPLAPPIADWTAAAMVVDDQGESPAAPA